MSRKDIEFKNSIGVTLRGWLYTPTPTTADVSTPLPCLVMVHGFSALKEMGLDRVAEEFVKLNLVVLVYDNRGFGASDAAPGQPRNEIVPHDQIHDFQDAITYAQSLPEVEASRVGIWGTSYSAGHALHVAATDKRVKVVIAQAPFVDGPTTFSRLVRPDFVPGLVAGFEAERQARAAGYPAPTFPVVDANPMAQVALPTPDSFVWFNDWASKSKWENELTIRSMELMRGYAPGHMIELISPTPLLMVVLDRDTLTAADLSLKAYARALEPKELVLVQGGHFDVYASPCFDKAMAGQIDFLKRNLCV